MNQRDVRSWTDVMDPRLQIAFEIVTPPPIPAILNKRQTPYNSGRLGLRTIPDDSGRRGMRIPDDAACGLRTTPNDTDSGLLRATPDDSGRLRATPSNSGRLGATPDVFEDSERLWATPGGS